MKKIIYPILTLICLCSCQNIINKGDASFKYAQSEAKYWTAELQKITPLDGEKLKIKYVEDPSMEELGQFEYQFDANHTLVLLENLFFAYFVSNECMKVIHGNEIH